jgi:hypothetical protein
MTTEESIWRDTAIHLGTVIERVRKLHVKRMYVNNHGVFYVCDYCTSLRAGVPTDYPCGTVRVIEGSDHLAVLGEVSTN